MSENNKNTKMEIFTSDYNMLQSALTETQNQLKIAQSELAKANSRVSEQEISIQQLTADKKVIQDRFDFYEGYIKNKTYEIVANQKAKDEALNANQNNEPVQSLGEAMQNLDLDGF